MTIKSIVVTDDNNQALAYVRFTESGHESAHNDGFKLYLFPDSEPQIKVSNSGKCFLDLTGYMEISPNSAVYQKVQDIYDACEEDSDDWEFD